MILIGSGVRSLICRLFGVSAGAELALAIGQLAIPIARPSPNTPQEAATVAAVRWGLYVLFAILGSGAWAMSRPPGLKPYFDSEVRYPVPRMIFTGFSWGMFALLIGQWRHWEQAPTTALVFILALMWEFLMISAVWVGRRFSSNPVQFWQDMRSGRDARARWEAGKEDPDERPSKRKKELN